MPGLRTILVATDFGEPADAALRYGAELARRFDASLHVLHVVDDLVVHPPQVAAAPANVTARQKEIEDSARTDLAALMSEPERATVRAQLETTVSASPVRAILDHARDNMVDLVIVGTHGRQGFSHYSLGSVAQQVSRFADCPVLTVRSAS